jgi:undecaprenyl-diphosphatase
MTYWVWGWRWWRRSAEPPVQEAEDALEEAGPVARTTALVPAMAVVSVTVLVIGALALLIERNTPIRRWDDRVERWAFDQAGPGGTDALRLITHLGDTVTVLTFTSVAVVVLLALAKRPRWASFLVVVVVGQWALANILKWVIGRPRPDLGPLVTTFSGNSFPSGHSTAAAATYLALALVVSVVVVRADRRPLVAVAVGLGVAVGGSRALLGVHWFTDVVAGLLLGWAWCLVSLAVLDPDRRRSPRPGRRTAPTG